MRIPWLMLMVPMLCLGGSALATQAETGERGVVREQDSQGPVNLSLQVQTRKKGEERWRTIAAGDTLASGDRIQMLIEVDVPAYVYVVQFFSDGQATVLYPREGSSARQIMPGGVTRIPEPGITFALDDFPGKEYVYVIASSGPLEKLDGTVATAIKDIQTSPGAKYVKPESPAGGSDTGKEPGSGGAGEPKGSSTTGATAVAGGSAAGSQGSSGRKEGATKGESGSASASSKAKKSKEKKQGSFAASSKGTTDAPPPPQLIAMNTRGLVSVAEDNTVRVKTDEQGVAIYQIWFNHVK